MQDPDTTGDEELALGLIESAEAATDSAERSRNLVRAALLFETKRGDLEKAFLILQTAFQDDPSNEGVAREFGRVTSVLRRWPAVLGDCAALAKSLDAGAVKANLLVTMAGWQQAHARDARAAESSLSDALALDPAHKAALRALLDLCGKSDGWDRAVPFLARAAQASRDIAEKLGLLIEAGNICRARLHDLDGATEYFQRVLDVQPGHVAASEALADIACDRGDWAAARPLLENLLPAFSARPRPERARHFQRLALAAEATGDLELARECYRRAQELDPDDAGRLAEWADLAFEQKWWDDVRDAYTIVLARGGAALPAAKRADALERLGRASLALGDAAAAADALAKALEIAPGRAGCREALVEALEKKGDTGAALKQRHALAGSAGSEDERFALLCKTARDERDRRRDGEAAARTFVEALRLRANDFDVLHELLDLLTAGKQWRRAVEVLRTLTDLETGLARAKYLVANGNILNYELGAFDEAVEIYGQALDEDVSDLKTFDRIDKILVKRQMWREQARHYRHMIKRMGPEPAPEMRPALLALWRGLADICRTRTNDVAAATEAYQVCAALDPQDGVYLDRLAELYERQGPEAFAGAVAVRTRLLERAAGVDDVVRHLGVLRQLYFDHRDYDRVWCVCGALVAVGAADAKEREFYERYAGQPLPRPRAAVTAEMWHGAIRHPREELRLSQVFAVMGPSMTLATAQDARAHGLEAGWKIASSRDAPLADLVAYATGILGGAPPALYEHPELPGGIDLANLLDHAAAAPAFVIGRDVAATRTEKEIVFMLAEKLAFLNPEHRVLWPGVVSSSAELQAALEALLTMCRPALLAPTAGEPVFQQYAALFERAVPPHTIAALAPIVPSLLDDLAVIDVAAWADAVADTARRAALLVCGDIAVAAYVLAEEARAYASVSDESMLDLVRWSVSSAYLELRAELGIGIA